MIPSNDDNATKSNSSNDDMAEGAGRRLPATRWILGALISVGLVWIISYFFVDTLNLRAAWEPAIHRWTYAAGTIHRHRSEGWGTSHIGKYDINGIPDITSLRVPVVVIWGDSHVEAWQVDDSAKAAQALTALFDAREEAIVGVGIGRSGESVADYYFKIPQYEEICPKIAVHFVLLTDFDDVMPDHQKAFHAVFESRPTLRLVDDSSRPHFMRAVGILRACNMDFAWYLLTSLKDVKLRFALGPNRVSETNVVSDKGCEPKAAWSFLLSRIRKQTTAPIVFVYCPHIPVIRDGTVIYDDPDATLVRLFEQECLRNGVGFLDMTDRFRKYYRKTGRFPRGFANSRPSEGHFNEAGQYLIAEAIFAFVSERKLEPSRYVLHTN